MSQEVVAASPRRSVSPTVRNIRKFTANKLAMLGFIIMAIFILSAILAPVITPYRADGISLKERTQAPSAEHPLGTDKTGRDVFARLLYGGRMSILIGVVASAFGSILGMALGCVAGYFGGKIDRIIVRTSEIFMTFPSMLLILLFMTFMGQSVANLIIIFAVTGWMTPFRLVRGKFLTLREETYVQVCRAFGIGHASIMFRHILPNAISPIVVAFTTNVAGYILSEAGLSFIGLGVPSSVATWGNVLNAAADLNVLRNYWWLWVYPGLTISLFVLAVNFVGDGLRDVIDPKG